MAKILDKTYIVPNEFQLICKNCGCLAEYKEDELNKFLGMRDEEFVYFTCPNCKKKTYTLRENLPIPSNTRVVKQKRTIETLQNIKQWIKDSLLFRKISNIIKTRIIK